MSWLHAYWAQAGGNVLAMPAEGVVTAVIGFLLRNPLGRLLGRDALREAKAARQIAADLYEHHVGRAHPDAPAKPESEAK